MRVAFRWDLLVLVLAALLAGCAVRSRVREAVPPVMALRPVGLTGDVVPAEVVPLLVDGVAVTLFLPVGWEAASERLAIHFHTSPEFALGEHRRAGYRFPLVSVMLGSGSARYRAPFLDGTLFPHLVAAVEVQLRKRGVAGAAVREIDVSSFSAGYGAVRELVGQPLGRRLIRRIVLSDSLYAGLTRGADGKEPRVVQADQIDCWVPFAREAVAGRTTFVLTHSQIHTPSYASTPECGLALVSALGLTVRPVVDGSGEWPLLGRCDTGGFHVWSYGGTNANAHLVHPRTLAEVWQAVDRAQGTR
jgi:hypothetical protein